jgi:hypothetical protein
MREKKAVERDADDTDDDDEFMTPEMIRTSTNCLSTPTWKKVSGKDIIKSLRCG